MSELTTKKTFKNYYKDPDFRAKHLHYIKQKVDCECGATVSRNNMSHHKQTKKHQNICKVNERSKILLQLTTMKKEIIKLLKTLNALE
jgi:hypothetical protein